MKRAIQKPRYHIIRIPFTPGGGYTDTWPGQNPRGIAEVREQATVIKGVHYFFSLPAHIKKIKGILPNIPGDFDLSGLNTKIIESNKNKINIAGGLTIAFRSNMRTIVSEWQLARCFKSLRDNLIQVDEEPDINGLIKVCWQDYGVLEENYELRIYFLYE